MTRLFRLTLPALLAILTFGIAAPASAQDDILVMDMNRLWEETALGQDIRRQLQEMGSAYDAQVIATRDGLQSEAEDLNRQREEFIITDEVFEQRRAALEQQMGRFQGDVERVRQIMQYAGGAAQEAFSTAIQPDVASVVSSHNASVMFDKAIVFASTPEVEVTSELIVLIDRRITSLEVQLLPPQLQQQVDNAAE